MPDPKEGWPDRIEKPVAAHQDWIIAPLVSVNLYVVGGTLQSS